MKLSNLFLFILLGINSILVCSQNSSENPPIEENVSTYDSYLKDLEEQGYCVIPNLFSAEETEILYERVWHEYIEKAWPNCKMDDRSNWSESFPKHGPYGVFAGPAGQTQVMWDLRQDQRIVDAFAKIWNTHDLIVSMDGISVMCPPEIREGYFEPWPHVDQTMMKREGVVHSNKPPEGFVSESSLKTEPFTIQGQFLFEDSSECDGGFYCIPKSHLSFAEFAPKLEEIIDLPRDERRKVRKEFFMQFFVEGKDVSGNCYVLKHVTAPKGSLILWDSRTVHWNQHATKNRPFSENPKVRMVGYICYVPKARLTDEGKALRKKAFVEGVSTGHNASYPELKASIDHIQPEYKHYLEDPSYVQPKIMLTPLGESLLGFE